MPSSETTRLVPATRGDEEHPDWVRSNEEHEATPHAQPQPPAPRLPPRSCLFRTFLLIRVLATIVTLTFFLSQIGLWIIVPGILVQKVLRSYVMLFCAILVAAEWDVQLLPECLSPTSRQAYRNWFYRGFQYSFIGVIGLEESYATLGHNYPDDPHWGQVAVAALLKASSFAMFGVGILYMAMRVLFLNKLWEHVDARYQQQVQELRRQQSV